MQVALLTIGDELLAGDTANANATWIASRLTDRGATVSRILVVADDRKLIARTIEEYSEKFDATIVTGGLGDTPDDVTMDAVADAFDRPLAVDERARADVEKRLAVVREEYPDIALDVDAEASIPVGSRALINDPGLAPGCAIENVYVLPGVPEEMHAMFEKVAEEFGGDVDSRTFYTSTPEADMIDDLAATEKRFAVGVGCYPDRAARHNRIKLVGEDGDELDAAREWLAARLETVPAPEN